MRFITFDSNGHDRLGLRVNSDVIDVALASPGLPDNLVDLITGGPEVMKQAAALAKSAPASARKSLEHIRYRPVLPAPPKIMCLGLNYAAHAAEGGHDRPTFPSFFMRCATSLVGHLGAIVVPNASETLDYEAELVAVIGKTCRNVSAKHALAMVAGYSVFNDGSIREFQRKTSQWTIGKNFDATGGFGPEFVTADELPAGASGLRIQSRLNGNIMQDDNTSNMMFGVAETIEILTACMTLEAGDILVMGTPSGVGHARKPPVWMKNGDTCEIEIEGIGTLVNPIRAESS